MRVRCALALALALRLTQLAHERHGRAPLAAVLREPQRVLRVVQRAPQRAAAAPAQVGQQRPLVV